MTTRASTVPNKLIGNDKSNNLQKCCWEHQFANKWSGITICKTSPEKIHSDNLPRWVIQKIKGEFVLLSGFDLSVIFVILWDEELRSRSLFCVCLLQTHVAGYSTGCTWSAGDWSIVQHFSSTCLSSLVCVRLLSIVGCYRLGSCSEITGDK